MLSSGAHGLACSLFNEACNSMSSLAELISCCWLPWWCSSFIGLPNRQNGPCKLHSAWKCKVVGWWISNTLCDTRGVRYQSNRNISNPAKHLPYLSSTNSCILMYRSNLSCSLMHAINAKRQHSVLQEVLFVFVISCVMYENMGNIAPKVILVWYFCIYKTTDLSRAISLDDLFPWKQHFFQIQFNSGQEG